MNPFEYIVKQQDKIQYVSMEMVIERIHRDYKFIPRLKVSDVMEWMGSIYGAINYPGLYRRKITGDDPNNPHIAIVSYRGTLPVGFRRILKGGVRDASTKEVYRPSTNTFTEFQYSLGESPYYSNTDKVYNIAGGYIFVEDETATLELAYEAFPIDERGYPLVPDNEQVIEYAKNFIAEKITFNLFAEGKISEKVWDEIDKRRMFGAGSAQTSVINPTPDTMETWTWSRLKLMPRDGFDSSFTYQGNKEDLRLGTK